ncbi:DUF2922 domain-containing protein [Dialister sp.]|uniref:DUF2922 domain-containing protein n=1 Tax=Dialister sp. TaxID=1955814 RepID=UPI002E823592|nr:DUF2922 domain-containing protein [Dialister sp.]MEE3453766.1 DUF2922 domain-containing protein [Dialister sp.]
MKTLVLDFRTAGNAKVKVKVADAKDGLTLDAVKAAADKLMPVLVSTAGEGLASLEQASVVTTSTEILA